MAVKYSASDSGLFFSFFEKYSWESLRQVFAQNQVEIIAAITEPQTAGSETSPGAYKVTATLIMLRIKRATKATMILV